MRFGWPMVAAIWAAVGLTSPAKAALVFEESGTLSQLSPYTNYDPVGGSTAFISTFIPSYNSPSPIPPTSLGAYVGPDPATPWVLKSPIFHYTVTFVSAVPLTKVGSQLVLGDYYNDFDIVGGTPEYRGGDDNCGGFCPFPNCVDNESCLATNYAGNRITFSFLSQDEASWTCSDGPLGQGCEERWSYLNGFYFLGKIPISNIETLPELNQTFSLAVFAAVPEPATWATYVLGLGVMGLALRRRRRTTPAS